jgi:hypothetical protein
MERLRKTHPIVSFLDIQRHLALDGIIVHQVSQRICVARDWDYLVFENTGWIIDDSDQIFLAEEPEDAPDGANHREKACLTQSEPSL